MTDIFCTGLNHRASTQAPIEIREALAVAASGTGSLLEQISFTPSTAGSVCEMAVLATCNRFELYGVAEEPDLAARQICEQLAHTQDLRLGMLSEFLQYRRGPDAVRHLFGVAAGLDSMVLGEPQILGQVVHAHEVAVDRGTAGPILNVLFRKAIECGKRARAETSISEHAASVSSVAVGLARKVLGSLAGQSVLLIGAGEMAELAAQQVMSEAADRLIVVNRSPEGAERLAALFHGEARGWREMPTALLEANIVLCSAGAPHVIVHEEAVRQAMEAREHRPLFFIDIGMPRNVDPRVGQLPNVYLYNIDDLQNVVQENLAQREREVPRVQEIVSQVSDEFLSWLCSLDVVSTIRDLRSMADQICDQEIERALHRLGDLSEREQRIVYSLARGITNKLLHQPTIRLKQYAQCGDGQHYARSLRDLFALDQAQPEAEPGSVG